MLSLFSMKVQPDDIPPIPGLGYLPNYVSEEQEKQLTAAIDREPWDTSWERRRQPYGRRYELGDEVERPIPEWAIWLIDRFQRDGIAERRFDQMLVNEYLPRQRIAMHRDYLPFDRTVVSLSLLSACVMNFQDDESQLRQSLLLERRSLLILSDEARYRWQHGISRRKTDHWHGMPVTRERRVSVTFRLRKIKAK